MSVMFTGVVLLTPAPAAAAILFAQSALLLTLGMQ